MMLSISHIIFDLDDLLIDSEYLFDKCINQILSPFNITFDFDIKQKYLGQSYEDTIDGLVKEFNIPTSKDVLIDQYNYIKPDILKDIQLKPGARKIINYFWKNNIPMAIATGSADDSFALKTKDYKELFSRIHHVVCSGSDKAVKRSKPHPDIFLEAAFRFGDNPPLSPRNILVFEDAANGVKGALAANMKAVWVPDPRADTSIFQNHPDVTILTSLDQFSPQMFMKQFRPNYHFA